MDEEFTRQLRRGLYSSSNRAMGGLLGAPVDTINTGLGLLGMGHPRPVGGSDWINALMLRYGLVDQSNNTADKLAMLLLTPTPKIKFP